MLQYNISNDNKYSGSRDSSVSMVTGYRLNDQGSVPRRGNRFFSTPQHPDRLWGTLSLLYNGYQRLFSWDENSQAMKLITHLHLVSVSRMQ
jgi:hypothetical protein